VGLASKRELDRVPKKLSQHLHKKDGALNVAVINVSISLVNGGWREASDLLIRNKWGLVGRDQDNSLELLRIMVHPARLERATP